jgi:toxin YoeB
VKLRFEQSAWDDYLYWLDHDQQVLTRINELIRDTMRSPFAGIGKPEPLRGNRSGWWSRRITKEHRLVYRCIGQGVEQMIEIAQCRFHY